MGDCLSSCSIQGGREMQQKSLKPQYRESRQLEPSNQGKQFCSNSVLKKEISRAF